MIADTRRLIIKKIRSTDGALFVDWLGSICQNDGQLDGCDSIADLLIASKDDLIFQAAARAVSPLELLRRKLSAMPYIVVEVQ